MQDDAALQPQQDSAVDAQQEQQQQQGVQQNAPAYLCSASLLSGRETWCWQPAYATLEDPAPAQLTEVARLQSAADACTGHSTGRSDRISGLEFSPDGQLVATAGVSKQVRAATQNTCPASCCSYLQHDSKRSACGTATTPDRSVQASNACPSGGMKQHSLSAKLSQTAAPQPANIACTPSCCREACCHTVSTAVCRLACTLLLPLQSCRMQQESLAAPAATAAVVAANGSSACCNSSSSHGSSRVCRCCLQLPLSACPARSAASPSAPTCRE